MIEEWAIKVIGPNFGPGLLAGIGMLLILFLFFSFLTKMTNK